MRASVRAWRRGVGGASHRGVLAQLAERGEGFLVSLADLLGEVVQLCRHLVALRALLLRRLLLLLVSVIPDGCGRESRQTERGHPRPGCAGEGGRHSTASPVNRRRPADSGAPVPEESSAHPQGGPVCLDGTSRVHWFLEDFPGMFPPVREGVARGARQENPSCLGHTSRNGARDS